MSEYHKLAEVVIAAQREEITWHEAAVKRDSATGISVANTSLKQIDLGDMDERIW